VADTSRLVLSRLSASDLQNVKSVSTQWQNIVTELTPTIKLIENFNVAEDTAFSLTSPEFVYQKLTRIKERGNYYPAIEYELYDLFFTTHAIDPVFVHLLDANKLWFQQYFAERDVFFLASHLLIACKSGNLALVKFLIDDKHCQLDAVYSNAAIASGQVDLVRYLLDEKNCSPLNTTEISVFHLALLSGSADVLQYLTQKFLWKPQKPDFEMAVRGGSLEVVQFIHEHYKFDINAFRFDDFSPFISLSLIKYLIEELGWKPTSIYVSDHANEVSTIGYLLGRIDVIQYFETYQSQISTRWPHFLKALDSGSWPIVQYFFEQLGGLEKAPDIFSGLACEFYDLQNSALLTALSHGDLDIVKFIVEKCGLHHRDNLLASYALRSKYLDVLHYIATKVKHEITTTDIVVQLMHFPHLHIVAWLVSQCKEIDYDRVSTECMNRNHYMILYHLIQNAHFPVTNDTLAFAFNCYLEDRNSYLCRAFIEFLIDKHHLEPTQKMLDAVVAKEDQAMLSILKKNMPEPLASVYSLNFMHN